MYEYMYMTLCINRNMISFHLFFCFVQKKCVCFFFGFSNFFFSQCFRKKKIKKKKLPNFIVVQILWSLWKISFDSFTWKTFDVMLLVTFKVQTINTNNWNSFKIPIKFTVKILHGRFYVIFEKFAIPTF